MEGERDVIIRVNLSQLLCFVDDTIFLPPSKSRNEVAGLEIRVIRQYHFTYTKSFNHLHLKTHTHTHIITTLY